MMERRHVHLQAITRQLKQGKKGETKVSKTVSKDLKTRGLIRWRRKKVW
jgi:hypothetical protein